MLRPGPITAEQIAAVLGACAGGAASSDAARPTAPGQLAGHYAPTQAVASGRDERSTTDEWLIGFGRDRRRRHAVRRRAILIGGGASTYSRRCTARTPAPAAAHRGCAPMPLRRTWVRRSTTGCDGRRGGEPILPVPGRSLRRPPSTSCVRQSSCAASAAWAGSPPCSTGSSAPPSPSNPGGKSRPATTAPSGSIVVTIGPTALISPARARSRTSASCSLILRRRGRSRERYCVPTSLPWRLSWVGSCVAKKMSSRSPYAQLGRDRSRRGSPRHARCRPSQTWLDRWGSAMVAADIAALDALDADHVLEHRLRAPEAAACQRRIVRRHR